MSQENVPSVPIESLASVLSREQLTALIGKIEERERAVMGTPPVSVPPVQVRSRPTVLGLPMLPFLDALHEIRRHRSASYQLGFVPEEGRADR